MREIKLRKGKTAPGLEDTKDRLSYKEGGLLFVLSQERFGTRKCEHYQKGNSPFNRCVVMKDFMNRCCANCFPSTFISLLIKLKGFGYVEKTKKTAS